MGYNDPVYTGSVNGVSMNLEYSQKQINTICFYGLKTAY